MLRSLLLWLRIDDLAAAKRALKFGYFAALFGVGLTVLFIVLRVSGVAPGLGPVKLSAQIEAGVFFVIALGIRRASRVAACAGFGLYLFDWLQTWSRNGRTGVISVLLVLCFVQAIRGAFAVHRYREGAGSNESTVAV